MGDVIPTMIAIGLFVVVFTTIAATVVRVVDDSRTSMHHQEIRTSEQVNTIINGPEQGVEVQASSTIELTVRNTGNTRIGDFAQWDVILEIRQSTTTAITYMTYTTSTQPNANEWTLQGIYNDASSTTRVAETFSPGILDPGEDMVALLNPSPAVVAGTYDRATFVTPTGVTAKIIFNVLPTLLYVVDATDGIVYRYETDGTLHGTLSLNALNADAYGITTKGADFWTTDFVDDKVYKYTSRFALDTSWLQDTSNNRGAGITTDNTNIWIVDSNTPNVFRHDMSGTFIDKFSLTGPNRDSAGITTDGTNIWVVDEKDDKVYKYDMAGAFVNSFALTAANADATGITTDGTNIWVVDVVDAAVYKYDMTGTFVSSFALAAANADPQGVTMIAR